MNIKNIESPEKNCETCMHRIPVSLGYRCEYPISVCVWTSKARERNLEEAIREIEKLTKSKTEAYELLKKARQYIKLYNHEIISEINRFLIEET